MEHTPKLREQLNPFKKTIILVGGNGLDGKTTICSKMINENTGYISFDQLTWEDDLNIVGLHNIKRHPNYEYMIPNAFNHINSKYDVFYKYVEDRIDKIEKDIILIDSFYFTKEDFYKKFYSDLIKKYRVWEMKRI
jgi:hypothetical protein